MNQRQHREEVAWMCTGNDGLPGSVADALRMMAVGLDYLNGSAGDDLDDLA